MGHMKHIVLYSGGIGSYFTTKRLIQRGIDKSEITLLFTDTKVEDEDLYRFLYESANKLGIPITDYSDGRDIWQVFKDVKYLGNSRADPCSKDLKRKKSREFVKQFTPEDVIIYLGFDWSEFHRFEKARKAWLPYTIKCPLTEKPYLTKQEMMNDLVRVDEIQLPRLYRMGFSHNNCGGGCVKAGIGQFTRLLDMFPERFLEWETKEEEVRAYLEKDVTILRRTVNGARQNFSLKDLRLNRERITPDEMLDIGGCNCFID